MTGLAQSPLVCPRCRGDLCVLHEGLECPVCRTLYKIREGIPILLANQTVSKSKTSTPHRETQAQEGVATFQIVGGQGQGGMIYLKPGTCRAIGRSLDNAEQTQVVSLDVAPSLDDYSKKLVVKYVAKQYGYNPTDEKGLGGFRRDPDWQLKDEAISRLHAMIFFGEAGVGILDLVSRNGTYVNDLEIESKLLQSGDTIRLGGIKVQFVGIA